MNRQQFESLLILAGIALFGLGFALAAFIVPGLTTGGVIIVLAVVVLLLLAAGAAFGAFVRAYVFGARRLTEAVKLIMAANPTHRVKVAGPVDTQQLAKAINSLAERFQTLQDDKAAQVQQARVDLEEEKNRLAALMSELSEGVLVCNIEGRILLYNQRAGQLLRQTPDSQATHTVGGFVGLGRSIFGLLDRNVITHALEELAYRHEKQSTTLVSHFVATATNGQLIRVRLAPVLTQRQEINGFILTLTDITEQSRTSRRRDMLLQSLTEGIRSSLANIRAAIETIEEYPEMDTAKLGQLRKVIYEESLTLSARVNQVTSDYDTDLKADWQLEEMLGSDLLWAIQRRLEDKVEVSTAVEAQEENLWLKVDSYAIVQASAYLARRLKVEFGLREVTLRLKQTGQLAAYDLVWPDDQVDMDLLWSWQHQNLITDEAAPAVTLTEIAERHGGEIWCQADKAAGTAYFRLLLPTTQPKPTRSVQVVPYSRPEYYDFDLFKQAGPQPELDQRPLAELTYTVFDTETTGMDPSGGDEIISISAVRIVNGRLLRQEILDQLVDPKRSLSPDSTSIHGILPEMLAGQPTIEQVLPLFFHFTEGTVLVGHNAAFDMRLLELKEAVTGLTFTNPVLDTLLLSAVIHPNQDGHHLEAIAQRLGINIIGRHTSLGDAILTGEIFLKLIPLLAEKGIVTLKDAREAAQETYYARLSY
jgi:DNA polymerase-3 subunit epsilon